MPPRRGRGRPRGDSARAASQTPIPGGGGGGGGNNNNNNSAANSPAPDPTLRRTPGVARMSPGPSSFSSSYGSPAVLPMARSFRTGTARSALGSVLQSVRAANDQDRDEVSRDERGATRTSGSGSARAAAVEEDLNDDRDDGDAGVIDVGGDVVSGSMPPPPRPSATAPDHFNRSTSVSQPASIVASKQRTQSSRLGSEPPSDSRSFIEENELYRGAKFTNPTPRQREQASASPAPQSATRASARLAAKLSVSRETSMEMSPAKGRGFNSAPRPLVSESSIDDQNSEDPLNTPGRRGVRAISSQPPNSDASGRWTRPEDLQRETESREPESPSPTPRQPRQPRQPSTTPSSGRAPDLKERIRLASIPLDDDDDDDDDDNDDHQSDDSDEDIPMSVTRQSRVLFPWAGANGGSSRPNPIQDARSGDLALPRPDRPGTQPNPFRRLGQPSQSQPRLNPVVEDLPLATSARAKSPMLDSPLKQPVNRPQRQPSLPPQSQLLSPRRPQPPIPSRPSLLSSPRRPNVQSRPEPRADGFSTGAKAPVPAGNVFANQPALDPGRDNADVGAAQQPPEPVNAAPDPRPAEAPDPASQDSRFGVWRSWARDTKYEDIMNKIFEWSWMVLKIWAVLAAASVLYFIFIDTVFPIKTWDGINVHRDFDDGGVVSWRQKFLQIIPWIVLHPFSVLTGNLDYADYRKVLTGFDVGIQTHEARISSISAATWQMRRVLPELIKVDMKSSTGEWAIDDGFWNALDAEMHEGGLMYSLLTLDKSDDGTFSISDTHWNAIKQRIKNDHLLSDRPATGGGGGGQLTLTDQVVEHINQHASKVWSDWLKANEDAIKRIQGDKPAGTPSRTWDEVYGKLEEAMDKRLKALGLEQGLVTREEFIAKIEESASSHKNAVDTELEHLRSKLSQALGIAHEAKAIASGPHGVPREEVQAMIDEAMRWAISDANLEAIAKGHRKSHLHERITHMKNYFNWRRGATINKDVTSTTYLWAPQEDPEYQPESSGSWSVFGKKKPPVVFRQGGAAMGQYNTPELALEKWGEDGECWCAALTAANAQNDTDPNGALSPADLGVFTAESLVPQYLVVEHIDAGASFDPKSTPKDIEFWIRAPSDKRARTLASWSRDRWPAVKYDPASRRLVEKGYTKVGQFVYDNSATGGRGESQIFSFPRELLDFDAQTQQVVVRAKTNYGAEDHTCFYRVRLYGEDPNHGGSWVGETTEATAGEY